MTDTRIAHAYPNLSEGQALLALLSETLELARDLAMTHQDLKEARGAKLQELMGREGLTEEIDGAAKTAQETVVEILSRISDRIVPGSHLAPNQ